MRGGGGRGWDDGSGCMLLDRMRMMVELGGLMTGAGECEGWEVVVGGGRCSLWKRKKKGGRGAGRGVLGSWRIRWQRKLSSRERAGLSFFHSWQSFFLVKLGLVTGNNGVVRKCRRKTMCRKIKMGIQQEASRRSRQKRAGGTHGQRQNKFRSQPVEVAKWELVLL